MKFHRNYYFNLIWIFEYKWKQPFRGALVGGCFGGFVCWICGGAPALGCDFNKAGQQLCWGCTSAWVFSCGFAAFFFFSGCLFYIFPSTHITHLMCIPKHWHFIYFSIFSGFDDKTLLVFCKFYSLLVLQ